MDLLGRQISSIVCLGLLLLFVQGVRFGHALCAEDGFVCNDSHFPCYRDCCLKGTRYCSHKNERCQDCSDVAELCRNDSRVPVECLRYCDNQKQATLATTTLTTNDVDTAWSAASVAGIAILTVYSLMTTMVAILMCYMMRTRSHGRWLNWLRLKCRCAGNAATGLDAEDANQKSIPLLRCENAASPDQPPSTDATDVPVNTGHDAEVPSTLETSPTDLRSKGPEPSADRTGETPNSTRPSNIQPTDHDVLPGSSGGLFPGGLSNLHANNDRDRRVNMMAGNLPSDTPRTPAWSEMNPTTDDSQHTEKLKPIALDTEDPSKLFLSV